MPVSRDQIDAICAALPGATLAHPPEHVSWKLAGKMFACFGGEDSREGVSVKCRDPETAAMLIDAGAAIRAPYFHASWVRLTFADTDPDEASARIESSYDLIRASLPKSARSALPTRKGS